jgi:hypothetical protein
VNDPTSIAMENLAILARSQASERRAAAKADERRVRLDSTAISILNGYIFALKMNPEALMPLREKEPHGPMLALVRECYDLAYLMESERERRIKAEAGT